MALKLLATVLGQDLEQDGAGSFRIARRVAKDRVISSVDPEVRHGHKTNARHFDGYEGHIAIDPDREIITATAVTAGNAADGGPLEELIADRLSTKSATTTMAPESADHVTFGVLVGILEPPRPTVVVTTKRPDADAKQAEAHA